MTWSATAQEQSDKLSGRLQPTLRDAGSTLLQESQIIPRHAVLLPKHKMLCGPLAAQVHFIIT